MYDTFQMLAEAGQSLALLIALTFLYGLTLRKLPVRRDTAGSIIQGLLFGGVAVVGMLIPVHIGEGIIVDGHTVIVMLAGAFSGGPAALVAAALTASCRFYIGGVGAVPGIGAILTAALVGLVFAKRFAIAPGRITAKHLLGMSVIVTALTLSWVFALPPEIDALSVLARLVLPVGIAYPLGTLLLGMMLASEHRRIDLAVALRTSERRFRGLFENSEISIWNEDLSEVRKELDRLRLDGVRDLRRYLEENEQAAWDMAATVRVLHVNEATLRMFGAKTEDEFLSRIDRSFGPGAIGVFIEEFCAIWDKRVVFRSEAAFRTLDGKALNTIISFRIPGTEDGFQSIPVSIIEITESKRADGELRNIPVIAVTAFAMPEDEARIRAAGFDDYIVKPIQVEAFLETVDRHLSRAPAPIR